MSDAKGCIKSIPPQEVLGHTRTHSTSDFHTTLSARTFVTRCVRHIVRGAGTDTRARPTVPYEHTERLMGREPSAPVPARLQPPPRRPPRPLAAANAAAAAAAAAAGRLPGRWRGPSRAEPPRRSPTPRRAPRWLPLPSAPSPSRCRRQDPVGRPGRDRGVWLPRGAWRPRASRQTTRVSNRKVTKNVCCGRRSACRTCPGCGSLASSFAMPNSMLRSIDHLSHGASSATNVTRQQMQKEG